MISLILMKDFIVAPIIVFAVDSARIVIFLLILILALILIFTIVKKPFKSKIANFNLIMYSILYICVLYLFYYLEYETDQKTQKYRSNTIGKPCIFIILIILVQFLVQSIFELYEALKELCQPARSKVKPANTENKLDQSVNDGLKEQEEEEIGTAEKARRVRIKPKLQESDKTES